MQIGVVPDPLSWDRWDEAKALLEPARARGEFSTVIEPDELLWAVVEDGELLACATAWLSKDGFVEVKLVGGTDYRRWIKELDARIGAAAAEAGATRLMAFGRGGWRKALKPLGWGSQKLADGSVAYTRRLEGQ